MNQQSFSQILPNLPIPFEMLPVQGGAFDMGDELGDLRDDARPIHQVHVSHFYIGKYLVTQTLWKAVMDGQNPSLFLGDDRPVENVSWDELQLFLKGLNQMTKDSRLEGHHYRLPTEAEWEYAARGGPYHAEGYKYAGCDRLKDVGWFAENSGEETKPVGLKYPNQLGVYDMSGNVREWCADWFGGTEYYKQCALKEPMENPTGPKSGLYRVYRGGSWLSGVRACRAAYRLLLTPVDRFNHLGFRLVLSLQSVG